MPSCTRQERHRARQEHERLEAQKRKAERMEALERRMRKQAEDAVRARADRARRHQERTADEVRRRREKDARYASWPQSDPPSSTNPINEAVSRYKAGLEHMNQLAATPSVELSFADIAWPTLYPIHGTHEISKEWVEQIALSGSLYPGKDRRGRLLAFLLQWHPDKFLVRWIQLVRESDRAAVKEGVTMITGIVNDLLSGTA